MRAIIALALLVLLSGCGARSQLQVAADTRAAAQAVAAMPDGPARTRLYEAIGRSVVAMTEDVPGLPAPTWTPDEIKADVELFVEATATTADDPPMHEPIAAPQPPRPGPPEILREIGEQALRWGAWGALFGVVALLLRFVPWWGIGVAFSWAPVSAIAGIASSIGGFATVTGAVAMWLSDYLWIVVLSVVVSGVGVAIFHLPRFKPLRNCITAAPRRIWSKIATPKPKV